MDVLTFLKEVLGAGGVSGLVLVGTLFWLFRYYIPTRDALYEKSLANLQITFEKALKSIVEAQDHQNSLLNTKLDALSSEVKFKLRGEENGNK